MHSITTLITLAMGLLSVGAVVHGCESHGVDFQNGGGPYFQNQTSLEPFSFVSIYEKCEADVATNILVDPVGDEYLCSDTPLQPDDTNQMSTCPLVKNEMFSGRWAVLILSNNGEAEPVGFEREFDLIVGKPVTTTFTPTISVTVTSTPISTTTSTTKTITTNTVTRTTTLPKKTIAPTKTIKPAPVFTTKVFGPTVKITATEFKPVISTKTLTKTCKVSTQTKKDPTLTWRPTSLPTALSGIARELSLTQGRDTSLARRVPADRKQRISERKARIAAEANANANAHINKRGLDSATFTITATNPADWITSTSVALAPTSTITSTYVSTITQVTTSISTVYSGTKTIPTKYITLPTETITKFKPTIFTTTVATITKSPTFTVTVPKNDPAATKACKIKGGHMVEAK
ncbi:uncharacterized protein RCC_10556 [Ramularia collo-cygni]|uniref:Uncharacterized protein n=1 Tax=Ramularia collo-cygni TaxID=112498 RepID=A0A2D3VR91_9PEZI|nr:uncharacterized protein RCC_10556 [Ramularia collo-cygni]CZT24828.1 uncharacterized protein RCC_10556 [Ramularia collo-cygni]